MNMPPHKDTHGFTLIELLIAISIFGMVIGVAYSSYNASFTIINDAGESAKTYAKARTTMERIMADLESLYIGRDILFSGSSEDISGHRADSLQFASTAFVRLHPKQTPSGHHIIHYQVEEDQGSGSLLLYRSQYSPQASEETIKDSRLLLCDNLQEVAFDYRDKEGEELTDWDKEENADDDDISLPTLISISLRFNDSGDDEPGTLFTSALTLPMAKM